MIRIAIIISLVFFSCGNPYRKIAGDSEKRKPWEREILLSEAAKETIKNPLHNIPTPPPRDDSVAFNAYIKQLELGLQSSQEEYYNLSRFIDSMDMLDCEGIAAAYGMELNKLREQIKALKNVPPVIRQVPIPWENTDQLELYAGQIRKLKSDLLDRDLEITKANKDKQEAQQGKKDARKYMWMFWGLVALIVIIFIFKVAKGFYGVRTK